MAIDIIVKTTRKWGHIAGVHTDGPATALRRFEAGFQMCTILNDVRLMAVAAAAGHQRGARQGPGRQGEDVLRNCAHLRPLEGPSPLGRGRRGDEGPIQTRGKWPLTSSAK